MKNLKKVLALVLVVATLMGLATVAGAAYSDAKDIEYTEAVEVMSALGILNGNPDGTFAPTKSLTRAQAAKMVSYLLNGGKDVNDLYSGANTFSDCTTNWAKGYIAYVNQTGIVSGVGGGKFNPNGTLTGVALAKMMLTSLGYDAVIEKYQNDTSWMVNVLNDAQDAGLLDGLDTVNMYGPITREQASQMMFNALKATMVRYENKGTEFEINGVPVIIGASDPEEVSQGTYSNNLQDGLGANETPKLQLAEKYFGGNKGLTKKNTQDKDDFGRPAHEWKYDNKSIGVYADEADLTYTEKVELGDIYVDLGKTKYTGAAKWEDGDEKTAVNIIADSKTEVGAQGALTEVFVDDFNGDGTNEARIVVINTYIGSISKFTKATDSADAYITIKNEGDPSPATSWKFETDAFTKDDEDSYVLYTVADGKIKSVTVPTTVEGSVSKYGTSDITVNGTVYKLSAANKLESTNDFDGTYTFYLDTYGNVIFSKVVEAGTQNYAYITKIEVTNSLSSGTGVLAEVYLTDGTKSVVDVAVSGGKFDMPKNDGTVTDDAAISSNTGSKDIGYWFNYSVNSAGDYTFNEIKADYAAVASATVTLKKDEAKQIVTGKYTTANTVVSVYDKDDEFTTATGLIDATLNGSKILVTYSKGSSAVTAVYAVGVSSGVSTTDVTYAYAMKKDGETADGDSWKFVIDGEEVSYAVENTTNLAAGGVFTLNMSDKGTVKSVSTDKGVKNAVVAYADANTVSVSGGSTILQTTSDFAVYNVVADDIGPDSLEKGDTITYVLENGKIAIAFITKEAQ